MAYSFLLLLGVMSTNSFSETDANSRDKSLFSLTLSVCPFNSMSVLLASTRLDVNRSAAMHGNKYVGHIILTKIESDFN